MRTLVAILLIATFLGGCAETEPVASEEPTSVADTNSTIADNTTVDETLDQFTLVVEMPGNATAGVPFNVTIDTTLPADAAANATWSITGNGTLAEGTGVPTVATLNLTEGNHTLITTVLAEGYTASVHEQNITALVGEVAIVIPDTMVFEGTVSGASVGGVPGQTDSQTFTVDVPVSTMKISMSHARVVGAPEVDHDLDWSWSGPGGISGSAAAFYGPEADVTFTAPAPGEWTITMEKYSGPGDTDYTLTVSFT